MSARNERVKKIFRGKKKKEKEKNSCICAFLSHLVVFFQQWNFCKAPGSAFLDSSVLSNSSLTLLAPNNQPYCSHFSLPVFPFPLIYYYFLKFLGIFFAIFVDQSSYPCRNRKVRTTVHIDVAF